MKCSKAHKLISPYIDGELIERNRKPLEDHIKVCHKCRKEFEEGKELHNLFANTDKFKAPYGFHARVMANISSGEIRRSFKDSRFCQTCGGSRSYCGHRFGCFVRQPSDKGLHAG